MQQNVDFNSSRQRQNKCSRNVDLEKKGKDKLDKVSNEDVSRKVNESRNMFNVKRQRKCRWISARNFRMKND